MPSPPTEAAEYLMWAMQHQGSPRHPIRCAAVTAQVLRLLEKEHGKCVGFANALALSTVAVGALIFELNDLGDDISLLLLASKYLTNFADGRPALPPDRVEFGNLIDGIITQKEGAGLPVEALHKVKAHILHAESHDHQRRPGGAVSLDILFTRVMAVVLQKKCLTSAQRRTVIREAANATARMPSQVRSDCTNLERRRNSDHTLFRLFRYAEAQWKEKRTLSIQAYAPDLNI